MYIDMAQLPHSLFTRAPVPSRACLASQREGFLVLYECCYHMSVGAHSTVNVNVSLFGKWESLSAIPRSFGG